MTEETSNEELSYIHQPDQFDLRQGHSNNIHFQIKVHIIVMSVQLS